MAHSRDERAALAGEIFANAFLPVLLLAVVAGGLIWFGVRRALAPLATIERLVRGREPTDLSPITGPVPVRGAPAAGGAEPLHAAPAGEPDADADLPRPTRRTRSAPHWRPCAPRPTSPSRRRMRPRCAPTCSRSTATQRWPARSPTSCSATPWWRIAARSAHASGSISWPCCGRWHNAPRPAASARRSSSTCGHSIGPALVEGDPISLREAFTNLLDNARNYAGDQFPVQIRLAATAERRSTAGRRRGSRAGHRGRREGPGARAVHPWRRRAADDRQRSGSAIVKAVADAHAPASPCSIGRAAVWSCGSASVPCASRRPQHSSCAALIAVGSVVLLAPAAGSGGDAHDSTLRRRWNMGGC